MSFSFDFSPFQNTHRSKCKFFKNKYGLVLEKKSNAMSRLIEDFSKYEVEVEVRSELFVLWFLSRIYFYRALTDPELKGYDLVPSVQNFKFVEAASTKPIKKSIVQIKKLNEN